MGRDSCRTGDDPIGDLRQAALARQLPPAAGLLKRLMSGPIGIAAARLAKIDVESLDANALFSQAVAECGEILDEHRADRSRLRFESGNKRAIVDPHIEHDGAELRWTQSQTNFSGILRCRERPRNSVQ